MSDNTEMQTQGADPDEPVLSESQIANGPIRTALVRQPRSGDTRANNLLSSGSVKTGEDLPPGQEKVENRQQIQRFRIAVDACCKEATRAAEEEEDVVERANAVFSLRDRLDTLWHFRQGREKEFGQIATVLRCLFLEMEPEEIETRQLSAVAKVLDKMRVRGKVTSEDLREYVKILTAAGCDVFRAMQ